MIRRLWHTLRAWLGEACDLLADWLTPGPPEPVAMVPLENAGSAFLGGP